MSKEVSKDEPEKKGKSHTLFVVAIIAIFVGVSVAIWKNLIEQQEHEEQNIIRLFTAEELMEYNGDENSKGLFLSILGDVFNVQKGKQHYGPGGSYSFFAGRDASRSFVTGEFEDLKKGSLDHVLSLTPAELVSLKKWRDFYLTDYGFEGRLIGRFYDEHGNPTEYSDSIEQKIEFGLQQELEENAFKKTFPPCNMEWSANGETKFWCTKSSGGVDRTWVGYPIQYFDSDSKDFICVCALKENFEMTQFRSYTNCDDSTNSCLMPNSAE